VDSVGSARVAGALAVAVAFVTVSSGRARAGWSSEPVDSSPLRIELWADRDDDDSDGLPDGEETFVPPSARIDLVPVDSRLAGATLQVLSGGEHARLIDPGGVPKAWGPDAVAAGWFQGLSPGRVDLAASAHGATRRVTLVVYGIEMRDGSGTVVDMARSHASLERTAPERVPADPDAKYDDVDALRVVSESFRSSRSIPTATTSTSCDRSRCRRRRAPSQPPTPDAGRVRHCASSSTTSTAIIRWSSVGRSKPRSEGPSSSARRGGRPR
jgi:hypothetical protein